MVGNLLENSGHNFGFAETAPDDPNSLISAPDAERGSIVQAHVVLKAGFDSTDSIVTQLKDHVKATIAPYKYPRSIVFCESLPKTATGKIQRYLLKS